MELFHKENNSKKIESDEAGNRSDCEWCPDLTAYRKVIFLHNITFDEIDTLLKKYADIWSDKRKIVCDFEYTFLPDDKNWIYLSFPNFKDVAHYQNFWNYLNLMIWLSQKTDKEFCLAIPEVQHQPLFLSTIDKMNPRGDSCNGIYADRDFYFQVPGSVFEWGPIPTSAFDFVGFLKNVYQFDTQWIPKVVHCKWQSTQITLTVPE